MSIAVNTELVQVEMNMSLQIHGFFKYPSRRALLWFLFSSSWILDKDSPIKLIIYYSLSKQLYFEVIEANLNVLWCYDVRAANTIGMDCTGCFNHRIFNGYFPERPDFWSQMMYVLKYLQSWNIFKPTLQNWNGTLCRTGNNCTHAIFRLFSKSGRVMFL